MKIGQVGGRNGGHSSEKEQLFLDLGKIDETEQKFGDLVRSLTSSSKSEVSGVFREGGLGVGGGEVPSLRLELEGYEEKLG